MKMTQLSLWDGEPPKATWRTCRKQDQRLFGVRGKETGVIVLDVMGEELAVEAVGDSDRYFDFAHT